MRYNVERLLRLYNIIKRFPDGITIGKYYANNPHEVTMETETGFTQKELEQHVTMLVYFQAIEQKAGCRYKVKL
jgi:hypothetical protein